FGRQPGNTQRIRMPVARLDHLRDRESVLSRGRDRFAPEDRAKRLHELVVDAVVVAARRSPLTRAPQVGRPCNGALECSPSLAAPPPPHGIHARGLQGELAFRADDVQPGHEWLAPRELHDSARARERKLDATVRLDAAAVRIIRIRLYGGGPEERREEVERVRTEV